MDISITSSDYDLITSEIGVGQFLYDFISLLPHDMCLTFKGDSSTKQYNEIINFVATGC